MRFSLASTILSQGQDASFLDSLPRARRCLSLLPSSEHDSIPSTTVDVKILHGVAGSITRLEIPCWFLNSNRDVKAALFYSRISVYLCRIVKSTFENRCFHKKMNAFIADKLVPDELDECARASWNQWCACKLYWTLCFRGESLSWPDWDSAICYARTSFANRDTLTDCFSFSSKSHLGPFCTLDHLQRRIFENLWSLVPKISFFVLSSDRKPRCLQVGWPSNRSTIFLSFIGFWPVLLLASL